MTRTDRYGAWAAVLALASIVASISVGIVALTVVTAYVVSLVRIGRAGGMS